VKAVALKRKKAVAPTKSKKNTKCSKPFHHMVWKISKNTKYALVAQQDRATASASFLVCFNYMLAYQLMAYIPPF